MMLEHASIETPVKPDVEEPLWGPAALEERRESGRRRVGSLATTRETWIKRNRYYYRMLGKLLRFLIEPAKKVLSVRCGPGHELAEVAPAHGTGIDISPAMIAVAKARHPDFTFHVGFPDTDDFHACFNEAEPFDYVLVNCIDDTVDVEAALRNLRKVANRHTRLVLISYNHLWEPLVDLAEKLGLKFPTFDRNWLSSADLVNFLELSGYEWLKTYRIALLPKYIPLLSEIFNGFVARLPVFNRLCLVQVLVARLAPESVPTDKLKVSVVIPCKDERGNIESAVNRIPKLGGRTEIIFCDDKSTDGTDEEVRRMQKLHPNTDIRLVAGPGICKSQNVWAGFEAATGDVLMILDADLTTMPEELPYFLETLAAGRAEFVNGSRLIYPVPSAAMKGVNMIGNKLFSLAFSYLLDQRVKDTLCGTKVMWAADWRRIKPMTGTWGTMDRWGDYDLLFGAAKLNLRIRDLPVHYQERIYGATKMTKVFKNGLIMLRMCFYGFLKLKLGY